MSAPIKSFATPIQSYRQLIRACHSLFSGDRARMQAAVSEINRNYIENRNLSDPEAVTEKLQFAKDIDTILRQNVVQGVQSQKDPDTYHIKIREETELGHNETIKLKRSGNRPVTNLGKGGCGGSSVKQ